MSVILVWSTHRGIVCLACIVCCWLWNILLLTHHLLDVTLMHFQIILLLYCRACWGTCCRVCLCYWIVRAEGMLYNHTAFSSIVWTISIEFDMRWFFLWFSFVSNKTLVFSTLSNLTANDHLLVHVIWTISIFFKVQSSLAQKNNAKGKEHAYWTWTLVVMYSTMHPFLLFLLEAFIFLQFGMVFVTSS